MRSPHTPAPALRSPASQPDTALQAPLARNLFQEVADYDAKENVALHGKQRGGAVALQPIKQPANWQASPKAGAAGLAKPEAEGASTLGLSGSPPPGDVRSPATQPAARGQGSRSPSPSGPAAAPAASPTRHLVVDSRQDFQASPSNSVLSTSLSSGRIDLSNAAVGPWRKTEARSEVSTRASEMPTPGTSRSSPKAPKPLSSQHVPPPPLDGRGDFGAATIGATRLSPVSKLPARQRGSPSGLGQMQAAQTSPDFRPSPTGGASPQLAAADSALLEASAARARRLADGSPTAAAAPVLQWAQHSRSAASLPLTNAPPPGPKGSMLKAKPSAGMSGAAGLSHSHSASTLDSQGPVEYVSADVLPKLPGGKVRKAAAPSWLIQT